MLQVWPVRNPRPCAEKVGLSISLKNVFSRVGKRKFICSNKKTFILDVFKTNFFSWPRTTLFCAVRECWTLCSPASREEPLLFQVLDLFSLEAIVLFLSQISYFPTKVIFRGIRLRQDRHFSVPVEVFQLGRHHLRRMR